MENQGLQKGIYRFLGNMEVGPTDLGRDLAEQNNWRLMVLNHHEKMVLNCHEKVRKAAIEAVRAYQGVKTAGPEFAKAMQNLHDALGDVV